MRYLPHTDADRAAMLAAIGVDTVDDLFRDVPPSARRPAALDALPPHRSELEVASHLRALAARNLPASAVPSFLGAGTYRHHVPAAVDALVQRGEFLTSYTPYQPEVSQGTLQYLFEFQTQVALLTGMEVANASMYDGSTACAEAVLMACRLTRRRRVLLSGGLHPHYREVVETRGRYGDLDVHLAAPDPLGHEALGAQLTGDTACVVVQYPTFFGGVHDLTGLAEQCQRAGALLVVVTTEIVSLGLLPSPGSMGADIVAAEGQSLGSPMSFGGPHLGLLATREKFVRQMPGHLCGQTTDVDGRRAWVLTLVAREQHIRREKATSNICTNAGLCALAFTIHLALLGETGFRRLAELNHAHAVLAAERLAKVPGVGVLNAGFFNEFTLDLGRPAAPVVERLAERGILAGVPVSRLYPGVSGLERLLLVAVTEVTTPDDVEQLARALMEVTR